MHIYIHTYIHTIIIIINHHEYISTSKLHEIDSADSIYHRVGRDYVFEVTGIGNDTYMYTCILLYK